MREMQIHVWQIGPDGTEFYAARSEEDLRRMYVQMVGEEQTVEDFAEMWELSDSELDVAFQMEKDDGSVVTTSWRKEAAAVTLPAQIATGYA